MVLKITGLKELDKALAELPKATARNVLRRVLTKRAQPIATHASELAPDDPATPGKSIRYVVGNTLSPRQRSLHRRQTKDDKAFAEVFLGQEVEAGAKAADPAGVQQEFGNINHGPQPSLRPAWEAGKAALLDGIAEDMRAEIEKSAKRLAAKAARAAAKG